MTDSSDLDNSKKRRNTGRKPVDDPRVHAVCTRLNDQELAQLDAQRNSLGRGEYLRMAALHKLPTINQIPGINRDQWIALSRLSSNLNQIAAAFNVNEFGVIEDIRAAKSILVRVRSALIAASQNLNGDF